MNLIIYETTHYETLPALLELSTRHFKLITVFLTEQSYVQILQVLSKINLSDKVHFQVQKEGQTNRAFIKLFFKELCLKKYTHLHINTLEHNMLFFSIRLFQFRHIKISMTSHVINAYKSYTYNNLKQISESFAKLILHKKINNYRVLAPAMEKYFVECFPTKKVVFIPGNFYVPTLQHKNNDSVYFTIAIPGTVEAKRRDYPLAVRFIHSNLSILKEHAKIKIILLGSAASNYGKDIVSQFQSLVNDDFQFQWFDNEVDQKTYDKIFCEADIIWNPIIVHTKGSQNVPETSSISISPGFFIDQMHFGKPAIIPKGIQVHEVLKDCNLVYGNEEELKEIFILILFDSAALNEKNVQTADACTFFNIDNFKTAFKGLIC